MRRAIRTFGCAETKWLCQKSVIRSVSGDGVAQHLAAPTSARSSRPSRTCCCGRTPCARPRSPSRRAAGAAATCRAPTRAAGVTAIVRVSRRSFADGLAAGQRRDTRGPRLPSGRIRCGRADDAHRRSRAPVRAASACGRLPQRRSAASRADARSGIARIGPGMRAARVRCCQSSTRQGTRVLTRRLSQRVTSRLRARRRRLCAPTA